MFGLLPHPGPVNDQALLQGQREHIQGWVEKPALYHGTVSPPCGSLAPFTTPSTGSPALGLVTTLPLRYLLQAHSMWLCLHTRGNSWPAENSP